MTGEPSDFINRQLGILRFSFFLFFTFSKSEGEVCYASSEL